MKKLEGFYAGDDRWQRYVALYNKDYFDDNAKFLASKLNGALDLAVVIYGKRGIKEGIWWIEQHVPMLDNLRPVDCLDDKQLIYRLRECLMRMS
ncbi:hypothetical protein O3S68_07485 [Kosakonia sp. SOY2]|uniref:hypothetical protein n=1 Tax=Kosakonia sp. SOY2 TaxID=3014557 RepID=UPI0022AC6CB5|nr:hypothetical protein [Kosakonia sp. SOY2]MCZ3382136.1 hypothetical protein [Kosakonia sp. SOY2]